MCFSWVVACLKAGDEAGDFLCAIVALAYNEYPTLPWYTQGWVPCLPWVYAVVLTTKHGGQVYFLVPSIIEKVFYKHIIGACLG